MGEALLRVADLPTVVRRQLCRHLDADDGWRDLAGAVGLSAVEVALIDRRCTGPSASPTDQVLVKWAQHSLPRVLQLYTLLFELERIFEMELIADYVPERVRRTRPPTDRVCVLEPSTPPPLIEFCKVETTVEPPSKEICELDCNASMQPKISGCKNATPFPSLPQFAYDEIRQATQNFSEEFLLGQGRFSSVYRCTMRNTIYAVKARHIIEKDKGAEVELQLMQNYPHDNILPVYGYCFTANEIFLCCQFMANGSLEDRLACKTLAEPLMCEERCRVAVGAARGLQYLHDMQGKPVIHGNVKSSNILLDKHLEAKLSDFAFAKQATSSGHTHYTLNEGDPFGCDAAYAAPELLETVGQTRPSIKSDTYSFGIVLLEVCTGFKASSTNQRRGAMWLCDYVLEVCATVADSSGAERVKLADPRVVWDHEFFCELLSLALSCCSNLKKQRPDMSKVFANLQRLDADLQIRQRSAINAATMSANIIYDEHIDTSNCNDSPGSLRFDSSTYAETVSGGMSSNTTSLCASSLLSHESAREANSDPLVMEPIVSHLSGSESESDENPSKSLSAVQTASRDTVVPDRLRDYIQEWESASSDDEGDADILLAGLESMSFLSLLPTEHGDSD